MKTHTTLLKALQWTLLAALLAGIGAAVVRGTPNVIGLVFTGAALGYGIYLLMFWLVVHSREASIENGRLVITSDGRVRGSVRLSEPFQAKCIHYDGKWALYEVRQEGAVLRFGVPRHDSGDVVTALKLPWPPSTTPYGSWMR